MSSLPNIIWIDQHIENKENSLYRKELESLGKFKINCYKEIKDGIDKIKSIEFEETFIIISGRLFIKFIGEFLHNLIYIYTIPKIIIFTLDINNFLNNNKAYLNVINHKFYNFGGIKTSFKDIKEFLLKNVKNNKIYTNKDDNNNLVFDYIDSKEKLILPILYKTLIKEISKAEIEIFKKYLDDKYSKKSEKFKKLLKSISNIQDIPIELLSKYYARLYTEEDSYFYGDLNRDLRENKKENYLSYIKVLYEGVSSKSLFLASNNILYRGSLLSKDEINKIHIFLNNKLESLPGAIVFSKTFLSFTKDINIAYKFLNSKNKENFLFKVLFILEKDNSIDYSLSTHADIEKLSFFPNEKEVLFFPFSSFEIEYIKDIYINNEKIYEIKLLYLGRYLNKLQNDKILINKEIEFPNCEFKTLIIKFGLIEKEKIENNNIKKIFEQYNKYKNKIDNNNVSNILIIGNEEGIEDEEVEEIEEKFMNIQFKVKSNPDCFINLQCSNFDKVSDLIRKGLGKLGVNDKNPLIYNSKILDEDLTLEESNIKDNSVVFCYKYNEVPQNLWEEFLKEKKQNKPKKIIKKIITKTIKEEKPEIEKEIKFDFPFSNIKGNTINIIFKSYDKKWEFPIPEDIKIKDLLLYFEKKTGRFDNEYLYKGKRLDKIKEATAREADLRNKSLIRFVPRGEMIAA